MPKDRRSRVSLSNKTRKEICQYALDHPNVKHGDIGLAFSITNRSTVTRILAEQEKWLKKDLDGKKFIYL
jgi:hypothetical protein